MRVVAPQRISLTPSRRLLLVQSLAHIVAAFAVLLARLPPFLSASLLLLLGASLAAQRRPTGVTALVLGGDGQLEKVDAEGTAVKVALSPQTRVLPFMVILLWREGLRLRALCLPGDSMSAGDFHTLRLWLRWRATTVN